MRILQVIEFFVPSKAGSVDSVHHLGKHLARRGHEVTVCASSFHEQGETVLPGDGFQVLTFSIAFQAASFYVTPGLVPWLAKHLKEYDIVHLNNFRSFQNAVASRFAVKHRIPYVISTRGSSPRFWGRERLKALYDGLFGGYIMEHAALVNALSQSERDRHLARWVPQHKVAIVPTGIDLAPYQQLPHRGAFRQRYGIALEEKVVLYLGRLHPRKHLDLLLRAFSLLAREMGGARLVLAGPDDGHGQGLAALARELGVAERVIFTGFVPDRTQAYVDADVHIQPAADEIFTRTVLEAWACGTPVITTRECGVAEGTNGAAILVEGREQELAQAMRQVLADEAVSRRLSREGRRAVEQFAMEKVAERMEGVYLQALEAAR